MTAGITRETSVKIGYVVFIIGALAYGLFRFNVRFREASIDDGVQNQLRNLYGLAREYSIRHGNQPTVLVSELDATALGRAGIRPPLNGSFPNSITLGRPLKVTEVDGRRTVVFDPAK